MRLRITKSARQYGYIIWSGATSNEMEKMLSGKNEISVIFNGYNIGVKKIDRTYNRISIGFGKTRELPIYQNWFEISLKDDALEVYTISDTRI